MKELEYPFDAEYILKKRKAIKKALLADGSARIMKKIAILGGSTTRDILQIMELFLLNQGIEAEFYECEYAQYWEEIMFGSEELKAFSPDIIYFHTSNRNIKEYPTVSDSKELVEEKLSSDFAHFEKMWDKALSDFNCIIIQNNFEPLFYRLLGNKDVSDIHGALNYINRLNAKFYDYAQTHDRFYINDLNYVASSYGLEKWSDPYYWYLYKYCLAVPAIPYLAFNVSNIVKSIYGKNKKAFVLDLDNTLWGGIVGDDGPENIEIGQETSKGQLYAEFQKYIKAHKDLGIMLNVNSKNEEENALAGLNRPDSVLNPKDFIVIKANWNPKDLNTEEISRELNIGKDALVFVDDNPAERAIVKGSIPEVSVPELTTPEHYIQIIDKSGFFEVTNLSEDDIKRNAMYQENMERKKLEASFVDYKDYLKSLEMKAEIKPFAEMYMARIAQLTNKSNQFNLTTKRCTQADIEAIANDDSYITLYGKLEDKFGDNGVVTVAFGRIEEDICHIDLWLMSCRVLKRDMEFAMMDKFIDCCKEKGVKLVKAYYYPTAKNKMVKDFYALHKFEKISEDADGNAVWELAVDAYEYKNQVIKVEE
ncbi:MAG: HAD-IIIC family phosphatase [Clostridia bacterium]|nr:HAD-IIIC family phosphatase [Clostridia bacterium]